MFNPIEELFAPGRRHTDDERRRQEHTRVDAGSDDPGRGPVDLTSGHVVIRPPRQRDTDRNPEQDAEEDSDGSQ